MIFHSYINIQATAASEGQNAMLKAKHCGWITRGNNKKNINKCETFAVWKFLVYFVGNGILAAKICFEGN